MQTGRVSDFGRITSERVILQQHLKDGVELPTHVPFIESARRFPNTIPEELLGIFRSPKSRKAVIADMEMLREFADRRLVVPSFLEAGPRRELRFDPHVVRAAIVTTGGLAPGLHCVVHSIVKRHWQTYSIDALRGKVFGVNNSFRGLCQLADNLLELTPTMTEEWIDQGGSKLGSVRYYHENKKGEQAIADMAQEITRNLDLNGIDILYVIGGDGSLRVAHQLAVKNLSRSIVGIPKTMDNDVLWVWQSFGFDTAVEQATQTINKLRSEAEATRRICLIELFGAESGFVAANAALASGHVDLVLIPEVFKALTPTEAEAYIGESVDHICSSVKIQRNTPHAVIVLAEGVGTILEKLGASIEGHKVTKDRFISQLQGLIEGKIVDAHGNPVPVFFNQPRHYVRAVPANAHDQIYCERLGALAVDNALAGYTNFMVSQWLTEFVLVPIALVQLGQKSIPIKGMFWKQVVSSTGQPRSSIERNIHHDDLSSSAINI